MQGPVACPAAAVSVQLGRSLLDLTGRVCHAVSLQTPGHIQGLATGWVLPGSLPRRAMAVHVSLGSSVSTHQMCSSHVQPEEAGDGRGMGQLSMVTCSHSPASHRRQRPSDTVRPPWEASTRHGPVHDFQVRGNRRTWAVWKFLRCSRELR